MTTIEIISREQWGARPPKRRMSIQTPTRELWLHHTAGNHRGPAGVRAVQDFHMDVRGWSDIAYSFLIDRMTLDVFEGRGFGIAGGHTRGHNTISHAICVMGNFQQQKPSTRLLERIAQLVRYGHEQRAWPEQFTGGHRDVASTACPGVHLYAQIPLINQLATQQPQDDDDMKPYQIETVTAIQTELDSRGYNLGPFGIDGDPGPATLKAFNEAMADLDRYEDQISDIKDIVNADE